MVRKKDYSLAVHRNKIKRWVRNIFKLHSLNNGFVVIVRPGFFERGYKDLCIELEAPLIGFVQKTKDK